MSKIIRYIGIDFGTSFSVLSYLDYEDKNGKLVSRNNLTSLTVGGSGRCTTLIPTVIRVADSSVQNDHDECGADVQPYGYIDTPSLIKIGFKMNLGTSVDVKTRDEAQQLTNKFFEYLADLYASYERDQNHVVDERRILVSFPAKWNIQERGITVEAATNAFRRFKEVADADSVNYFDEPTAALTYCIQSSDIEERVKKELVVDKYSYVLLIDMGAGTTDLVMFRYKPNRPAEVIATYPNPGDDSLSFGGREVDRILFDHFSKIVESAGESIDNPTSFLNECRLWKEELSSFLSKYPDKTYVHPPASLTHIKNVSFAYNKVTIGGIMKDYLPGFITLLNGIHQASCDNDSTYNADGSGPDLVILSGGHSQWYFVESILKGIWIPGIPGNSSLGSGVQFETIQQDPWRIVSVSQPQHIVSQGLCLTGMPIQVIHLNNSDIWVNIKMGNSSSKKICLAKKNDKLPITTKVSQTYTCRLDKEDTYIDIQITPYIGVIAEQVLDTIKTRVGTNLVKDLINLFNDKDYRLDDLILDLDFKLDDKQAFSFSGTVSTGGFFGYSEQVSMTPVQVAKSIRESR